MTGIGSLPAREPPFCVACGSERLRFAWSTISAFFAERALLQEPCVVRLAACLDCGTQYFDFAATDVELGRLYADYRGEEYFRQRHGHEFWYTRAVNEGMGGEVEMQRRRRAMMAALADAGAGRVFRAALDHGGDRGQMLIEVAATRKAVYEISGVEAEPGIEIIGEAPMRAQTWDLILSCHVLEHLTDPARYLADLTGLGAAGGTYFIEVPHETAGISRFNGTGLQRAWLGWLTRRPSLLRMFDFVSTGVRARMNIVPPLLFFPLREHLNFFSVRGIEQLVARSGLRVLRASILPTGHIGVVAVKPGV